MHRDPEYWDEPDQFKPERFLGVAEQNYSRRAFIPFGNGPRMCIGQKFAQNEIIIFLTKFVTNFKLEQSQGFNLEYNNGSLVLKPKMLLVNVTQRNPN